MIVVAVTVAAAVVVGAGGGGGRGAGGGGGRGAAAAAVVIVVAILPLFFVLLVCFVGMPANANDVMVVIFVPANANDTRKTAETAENPARQQTLTGHPDQRGNTLAANIFCKTQISYHLNGK